MKRFSIVALAALLFCAPIGAALAQTNTVAQQVGVCDARPYDGANCIRPNFDGSVNISGSITASPASVGTNGATIPGSSDQVGYGSSGNLTPVDTTHGLPVNIVAGSSGNAAASATGSAVPSSGDYNAVNVGGTLRGQTGVNPSGSVYAPQTDIASVNGVTISTGTGAQGTGTPRVTVATDSATVAGSASIPAGTNLIGKFGIDQTTPGTTNEVVAVGAAASGASVSGNPLLHGGRAQNAENTAVTNGQAVADARDLTGKEIVAPYANKENFVSGAASATGTGATTIISAPGASVKLYITSLQCFRSDAGTTLAYVTLDDGASTLVALPNSGGGGGSNLTLPVPLVVAANTALTFTASTSLSTVYCQAQGYKGS